MTKFLWLLLCLYALPIEATPVVPQFRSGSSTQTSTSQSVINETITSHQYRSGYSYTASGNNIESADLNGYINPSATSTTTQTIAEYNLIGQALLWKLYQDGK